MCQVWKTVGNIQYGCTNLLLLPLALGLLICGFGFYVRLGRLFVCSFFKRWLFPASYWHCLDPEHSNVSDISAFWMKKLSLAQTWFSWWMISQFSDSNGPKIIRKRWTKSTQHFYSVLGYTFISCKKCYKKWKRNMEAILYHILVHPWSVNFSFMRFKRCKIQSLRDEITYSVLTKVGDL